MPTTDYKRDERLQVIHKCLLNTTKKWSVKKLLEIVNNHLENNQTKTVSARTIADDLKYLELKKFAPIITIRQGREIYYQYDTNEEVFELYKPIITADESFSLVIAKQILKQLKGFSLIKDLEEITKKLQHKIDDAKEEDIILFEEQPQLKNIHFLEELFECIKEKTVIKLQYKSFKATEVTEAIMHPYLLKQYNQRWFLFSYDEINNRITNSALDRIISIKPTSFVYNESEKIQLKSWFDDIIGVSKSTTNTVEKIEFKITQERDDYIVTKPIHRSQKFIKEYKNGDKLFELRLIINKELVSTLQSYGKDLIVQKPFRLKEML